MEWIETFEINWVLFRNVENIRYRKEVLSIFDEIGLRLNRQVNIIEEKIKSEESKK